MTFEEFQATGRDIGDMSEAYGEHPEAPGRVYANGKLWIEDARPWQEPGVGMGNWYTVIGRSEYQTDDLEQLERILYDFACHEDLLPQNDNKKG